MKTHLLFIWVLIITITLGANSCSNSSSPSDPVSANIYDLDGKNKLYDLVPDFIAYAQLAADSNEISRTMLWDSMLEEKWLSFFNSIIYRGLTGQEKEKYKDDIIQLFWDDVVPNKISNLKQYDPIAVQKILSGRNQFKNKFSDFEPDCDYYLTVSFSFNGKAADLNGKTVFAIGLENFKQGNMQLDFTIAHEQYHLYHFGKGFSPSGGLYRGIWTEGMATYSQLFIYPGNYSYSDLLGFSGSRIDEIVNKFDFLKNDLMKNIYSSDQAIKRAYLGEEDNDLGIPPASGYYLGLRIVLTLMEEGNTFEDMTLWTAETVQIKMNEVLPDLIAN